MADEYDSSGRGANDYDSKACDIYDAKTPGREDEAGYNKSGSNDCNKVGGDDYDGGYKKTGNEDYGLNKSVTDDYDHSGGGYKKSGGADEYTGGGYKKSSSEVGVYGSSRDESEDYRKVEKEHKHKEHLGEMGTLASGAFALYEKHQVKDPENTHRHKIEEEVAAMAAVGSGGYALHEHHEKKEYKESAEDAVDEEESGRGDGKKKHHFFG